LTKTNRTFTNYTTSSSISKPKYLLELLVIVIVNSWFLERPQKRNRRNQLIHRRLTKTKSIGSGQDSECQAGGALEASRLW